MKLQNLSPATLDHLKRVRYDRIVGKHEGPEKWSSVLEFDDPEFLDVDGRSVLLPVPSSSHSRITVVRCIVGDEGKSLTLFLKDTSLDDDPQREALWAGFVAVCDRFPGEEFFVAIVYHEWFLSAPSQLT